MPVCVEIHLRQCVKSDRHWANFDETQRLLPRFFFGKEHLTEFHENATYGLHALTRSQTDGGSASGILFRTS